MYVSTQVVCNVICCCGALLRARARILQCVTRRPRDSDGKSFVCVWNEDVNRVTAKSFLTPNTTLTRFRYLLLPDLRIEPVDLVEAPQPAPDSRRHHSHLGTPKALTLVRCRRRNTRPPRCAVP